MFHIVYIIRFTFIPVCIGCFFSTGPFKCTSGLIICKTNPVSSAASVAYKRFYCILFFFAENFCQSSILFLTESFCLFPAQSVIVQNIFFITTTDTSDFLITFFYYLYGRFCTFCCQILIGCIFGGNFYFVGTCRKLFAVNYICQVFFINYCRPIGRSNFQIIACGIAPLTPAERDF